MCLALLPALPAGALPIRPGASSSDRTGVRVVVATLSPRDATPATSSGELRITGTVQNTGSQQYERIRLRVQRGSVIKTRGELHQADDGGSGDPVAFCEWSVQPGGLRPGQSAAFDYRCPLPALSPVSIGIYPLTLQVQGSTGDGFEPAGEVNTYLPSFPDGVAEPTRVSWLWPLLDRPHHRPADGVFLDEDLGASVSEGGRLDRMLDIAEQAGPTIPLALVLDPALVDELTRMEHGYRVRSGAGLVNGRFGPAATAWLNRLRTLAATRPLATVPYGDPDLVALQRAGLLDLATTPTAAGDLVAERLRTDPATTLAWPPGEAITGPVLAKLTGSGARAVVLSPDSLPDLPAESRTPSAVAALGRSGVLAIVPDRDLSLLAAESGGFAGGRRLAEQRYLTELAMITAEQPSHGRDVVVLPPRRWNPDPDLVPTLLKDTATVPWLRATSTAALAGARPELDRGDTSYPERAQRTELPPGETAEMARIRADVADFATSMVDHDAAADMVETYDHALRLAGSSAWRDEPAAGRQYLDALGVTIDRLRAGVHIVRPAGSGVYSLASSDSPLLLTLANDLPDPVRIRIRITSRAAGFAVNDIGEQVIAASSRTTIRVPARVERSGLFVVDAAVTTPAGRPLGEDGQPVQLRVRSTAYGAIGLVITGAALALLLLLVARRLIRRARHRGTEPDPDELSPHAEEAFLSPVGPVDGPQLGTGRSPA